MKLIVIFFIVCSTAELLLPSYHNTSQLFNVFFNNYQLLQNVINIKILKDKIRQENVDDWTNEIARSLQISDKTPRVETFILSETSEKVDFKKQNGSAQDQIILCWDSLTFTKFTEKIPFAIIPRARDRYFLFLTSPNACRGISEAAATFWINFGVTESVVFCNNRAFIYRPFARIKQSWGCLDSYTIAEFSQNFSVIENSLKNLNGYQFNVSLFPKMYSALPYAPKFLKGHALYKNLSATFGYVGRDALLLAALSKRFNFTPNIVSDKIWRNFGLILPSGELTGSYRDLANGDSIMAVNARFLLSFYAEHADLSTAFDQVNVCIVVPKSLKLTKGPFLYRGFDIPTRIFVGLTLVASTLFLYLEDRNFVDALDRASSFLLGCPKKINLSFKNFFYMTSCFTFNNVILVFILGHLYKSLTTVGYEKDIDTVDELIESEMPIVSYFWVYFSVDSDSVWKKLYQMRSPLSDDINAKVWYDMAAQKRNVAIIDSFAELEYQIKQTYTTYDGPLLHMLARGCVSSIYCVMIVQKGSPFLEMVNSLIVPLSEAGILNKWDKDVLDAIGAEKMTNLTHKCQNFQALTIEDFTTSFYMVTTGYGFATILLLAEIIYKSFSS